MVRVSKGAWYRVHQVAKYRGGSGEESRRVSAERYGKEWRRDRGEVGSQDCEWDGWDSDWAYRVAWCCAWWAQGIEARREIAQEAVCQAWERYCGLVRQYRKRHGKGHPAPRKLVGSVVRYAVRECRRYSPDRTRFGGERSQGYTDAMDCRSDREVANMEDRMRAEWQARVSLERMLQGCPDQWFRVASMLAGGSSWRAIADAEGIGQKKLCRLIERIRETLRVRGYAPAENGSGKTVS